MDRVRFRCRLGEVPDLHVGSILETFGADVGAREPYVWHFSSNDSGIFCFHGNHLLYCFFGLFLLFSDFFLCGDCLKLCVFFSEIVVFFFFLHNGRVGCLDVFFSLFVFFTCIHVVVFFLSCFFFF